MNTYKVKFFGSKEERKQIELEKTTVEANKAIEVEKELRKRGWKIINGLKISKHEDS